MTAECPPYLPSEERACHVKEPELESKPIRLCCGPPASRTVTDTHAPHPVTLYYDIWSRLRHKPVQEPFLFAGM